VTDGEPPKSSQGQQASQSLSQDSQQQNLSVWHRQDRVNSLSRFNPDHLVEHLSAWPRQGLFHRSPLHHLYSLLQCPDSPVKVGKPELSQDSLNRYVPNAQHRQNLSHPLGLSQHLSAQHLSAQHRLNPSK